MDPRLSNTAAQAHEWVPIRPGTDGALILAMMNVIVQESLYDANFVGRYTTGFEELKTYLADKTPAWAARITDVSADTIKRLSSATLLPPDQLVASILAVVTGLGGRLRQ